jgi:hypothetical protein
MRVWIHLCASCFLLGMISFVPVAADEQPDKTSNVAEKSEDVATNSDGVASVEPVQRDDASIGIILKSVSESLASSDLSEAAKQRIIEGVRKGLQAKSDVTVTTTEQSVDAGHTKDGNHVRSTRTIVLTDGVFTDGDGKQHHIELKSNGDPNVIIDANSAAALQKGIEFQLDQLRQLQGNAQKQMEEFSAKDQRYAIGIALRVLEEQSSKPEPNAQEEANQNDANAESNKPSLAIESVFDDSPAEKAGLKPGDILQSIDHKLIQKATDVSERVQEAGKANGTVTIEVIREGEKRSVEIKPTNQPLASSGGEAAAWQYKLIDPGYLVPQVAPLAINRITGQLSQLNTQEVGELKKQVESLRDEIRELKELIKAGQK